MAIQSSLLKGPELRDEDGQEFDTYAQAIEKVSKLTSARVKRSKRNLALPVLVVKGGNPWDKRITITEAVLTGAHATNGNLLTQPKMETSSYHSADVYPNVPIVRTLLIERAELGKKLNELDAKINEAEIEEPGHKIRDMDYEEALTALEAEYAKAKAAAEALEA